MPKRDATGPGGKGPKTGRGLGKCRKSKPSNSDPKNDYRKEGGRGIGRGSGKGRNR